MRKNRFVEARMKNRSKAQARAAHEARLCAIHNQLMSNLAESYVQESLDRLWRERANYRMTFAAWKHLGGASITDRIGRLTMLAAEGTIREKKWLLDAIADLKWVNPPVEIICDSIHYDIHIKVRSLRNTHGRGGQNPYEWKREDIMSITDGEKVNASRAHVKHVERASYPALTKWLESSMKRLVSIDDQLANIEDRLHRAQSSAAAYAEAQTVFTGAYARGTAPRYLALIDPDTHFLRIYRDDVYVSTYRDYETACLCGVPAPFQIESIEEAFRRRREEEKKRRAQNQ